MRQGSHAGGAFAPSSQFIVGLATLAGGLLAIATPSQAQTTLANSQCMQERAGFNLNCTANDVSVAGVARLANGAYDINITDPCSRAGDDVTFTARFDVVLTAQERHDIGIYFATDGDANGDGALTSDNQAEKKGCSVTTLEWRSAFGGVDLDGTNDPLPGTKKASGIQDTCGDINAAASPLKPLITVTAKCTDDDGDGFLDLPNCVSWRQSGANELCTSPADTFPGAPSKCKCDVGFDVPVPVPADVFVQKKVKLAAEDASAYRELATLNEPGGTVDFQVVFSVNGSANTPNLTLNTLTDDVYGDITKAGIDNQKIVSTSCAVPQTVAGNDGSYTCSFRVNVTGADGNPAPNQSKTITDTVTAAATDTVGNVFNPFDTAQVAVDDVKPAATLVKTASPTSCLESELPCDVTFSVAITNTSVATSDVLTFSSLLDNPYGNVLLAGGSVKSTTCGTLTTIAPGATYNCAFVVAMPDTLAAGATLTDIVTATGTDDEGNAVTPSDSADVNIVDVESSVEFQKSASPTTLKEPGGLVVYTLTVTNTSPADSVTIDSLMDNIFGDVTDVQGDITGTNCVVPQTLTRAGGANDEYSCTFTAYVAGNAGEIHVNKATVTGNDDDGVPFSLDSSATVNFTNEPPRATLNKTAKSLLVTYEVVVTNDSEAEDLTLSSLTDDTFGNITLVQGDVTETTCSVPRLIPRSGSKDDNGNLNDYYACTFKAVVDSSPHVNVVTGIVDDDDADPDAVAPFDSAQVTFGEVPDPD